MYIVHSSLEIRRIVKGDRMVGHTSQGRGSTRSGRSFFASRRQVMALSAAATFAVTSLATAGQIWDGGGANDNLGTTANWDSDALPNFAAVLQLAGTTRLTPNQETLNRTIGG